MDTKGIVLWGGLSLACAVIYYLSHRMRKQIVENGLEATGVISHIEDEGGPDEIDLRYFACYRTEDGKEVEGLLSNPRSDLEVAQQMLLKYHPKQKTNVRLVG